MGVRTEKYAEFDDTIDECYEIVVKEMKLSEKQKEVLSISRNTIHGSYYCYDEPYKQWLVTCIEEDFSNFQTCFYALCMAKTNKFPWDYFEKGKFVGRS